MRSPRHHRRARSGNELQEGDAPRAPGLSRRAFLLRSSTVVASGLLASRLGPVQPALAHGPGPEHGDHPEPSLPVWAATRARDGRYLGLSGDAAEPEVAELTVGGDGAVGLGAPLGLAFPDAFVPTALLATGGRLLAAGASIREVGSRIEHVGQDQLLPADRDGVPTDAGFLEGTVTIPTFAVRPSLVELTPDGPRTLGLEAQAPDGFGVATGIVTLPGRRLGVVIEGSGDQERAYNDVTRLAEAADPDGRAWTFAIVAAGLGEGEKSHAAVTAGRLFVATVDQRGQRTFHQRPLRRGAEWSTLDAEAGAGPLMAAVPRNGDTVEIVAPSGSEVVRLRHRVGASGWQHAGTVTVAGEDVVTVVPVNGTRGELVAVGRSGAVIAR